MTTTQINLVCYIALPLLGLTIAARLGVSNGAYIISILCFVAIDWASRFVRSYFTPESPEETREIDEEVERMEGRRATIHNNFDIKAPEDIRLATIDTDHIEIIHIPTRRKHLLEVKLQDAPRILDEFNAAIIKLREHQCNTTGKPSPSNRRKQ